MPNWSRFIAGAVSTRGIRTKHATYVVYTPADLTGYPVSETLFEESDLLRRGPMVVFQQARRSHLLVNMNPSHFRARRLIFEKLAECVMFNLPCAKLMYT